MIWSRIWLWVKISILSYLQYFNFHLVLCNLALFKLLSQSYINCHYIMYPLLTQDTIWVYLFSFFIHLECQFYIFCSEQCPGMIISLNSCCENGNFVKTLIPSLSWHSRCLIFFLPSLYIPDITIPLSTFSQLPDFSVMPTRNMFVLLNTFYKLCVINVNQSISWKVNSYAAWYKKNFPPA